MVVGAVGYAIVALTSNSLWPLFVGPTVGAVGLGICKDTGVQQHIDDTARLEPDLYVAGLVHHDHELSEQEARAQRIAHACDAYVAFASFAGPTGGGYDETAARSGVWSPAGEPLAQAGDAPGEVARATIVR
jgi:predicted amidohydrolase